jgi:hypothetical protein
MEGRKEGRGDEGRCWKCLECSREDKDSMLEGEGSKEVKGRNAKEGMRRKED